MDERSIDNAGGTANYILWAGADSEEVAIRATDTDNLPGAGASLEELATWVSTFNARTVAGSKDIMTVTVRDGGANGVGDDATTTGTDESADDVDRAIPAVICETKDAPASESTTRYVSGTISISPTTTYCNRDNNRSALVYVLAYRRPTAPSVTPPVDYESYPKGTMYESAEDFTRTHPR